LPPDDLLLALLEDEELELEEVRPPLGILLREEMADADADDAGTPDDAVAAVAASGMASLGELPLRLL